MNDETPTLTIERAIAIAAAAHEGVRDKAGMPYIFHPLRVMLAVPSDAARIVGVLHDTIEDTETTIEDLRAAGLTPECEAALVSVTRKSAETYGEFIERAGRNEIGRLVKLADLTDNMDLGRISNPGPRDFERIEKYKAAFAKLNEDDK
tara:strand:+ start:280 stop:726 length:447 start_codon:yes stop_codon:yes gene_type:complete